MKKFLLFCSLIFLLYPIAIHAKTVTFEEQYTYDAGEADSKLTCRAISLLEVKKLLLEKLGTYLETETEVVNFQLTRDEVTTLTAGIVKTEIIDEKWDGKIYSLIAKIEVDPDDLARSIDELRKSHEGKEKIARLENVNEKYAVKIQELKEELAGIQHNMININRDFSEASKIVSAWELYEEGTQLIREGEYNDAISVFNKVIDIQPHYTYFYQRGKAYMKMKLYESAVDDFNRVIDLNPDVKNVYFHRGRALRKIGKKKKGLKDIKKAAELGSGNAKRWLKLKGK